MNRSGDNIDDVIYIGFVCGRASSGEIKLNCKQINERISGICVPCHIQINLSFISSPPSPIQVCHAVLVAIANWSRSSPLTGKCSAKSCPRIEIYIWVGLKWHYISTSWVEVLCLCCPVLMSAEQEENKREALFRTHNSVDERWTGDVMGDCWLVGRVVYFIRTEDEIGSEETETETGNECLFSKTWHGQVGHWRTSHRGTG